MGGISLITKGMIENLTKIEETVYADCLNIDIINDDEITILNIEHE